MMPLGDREGREGVCAMEWHFIQGEIVLGIGSGSTGTLTRIKCLLMMNESNFIMQS